MTDEKNSKADADEPRLTAPVSATPPPAIPPVESPPPLAGETGEPALVAGPADGRAPPQGDDSEDADASSSGFGPIEALRILGWAFVVLFYGSLLWVGVYRFASPPGTFVMLERKLSGDVIHHPWTPLEEISPNLVLAVIAAEDSRFCLHKGLDFNAIEKAVDQNRNGERRRGASTISQQTAKNAFLWNGGGWARKGAETWFTLVVETLWPKRRVMEVYLNLAEWGDGHFGAEAAAEARFGKSAINLTKYEASLLAAVLPSPNKWRVDPPGPYVQSRAGMLRGRMDQVRRDGLYQCVFRYK